jgi:hypothetical protein
MAIRLYAWNIEVSSAFWGPIGVLEVMLRNRIHNALRTGRSDRWWADGVNLAHREAASLQATIKRLSCPVCATRSFAAPATSTET